VTDDLAPRRARSGALPTTLGNPRIANRCPSCGHDALFIGSGGWLVCSWLECKNPGAAGDAIQAAVTTADPGEAPRASRVETTCDYGQGPSCRAQWPTSSASWCEGCRNAYRIETDAYFRSRQPRQPSERELEPEIHERVDVRASRDFLDRIKDAAESLKAVERSPLAEAQRTHDLKCWPEYFAGIASGEKTFELRWNDRDFQKGDDLLLREYDADISQYTGRAYRRRVTYVLKSSDFNGIVDGWCILGFGAYPQAARADAGGGVSSVAETQIDLQGEYPIWGRLGVGAEVWADADSVDRQIGGDGGLRVRGDIIVSRHTFRTLMNALRHCGEKHYTTPKTRESGDGVSPPSELATSELIENLAAYAHAAWSGWMRYLFSRTKLNSGYGTEIPYEWVDRWQRQMHTPYAELREDEKESDRKEARRMLAIVKSGGGGSALPALSVETCARQILDTFKKSEAQGYRSRDRQFAIELLEKALGSAPDERTNGND
jgi:hypothetical protein